MESISRCAHRLCALFSLSRLLSTAIEMRRAGRKIVAFKKQHPKYENSEEEAKSLVDLELDLLYTKVSTVDQEHGPYPS
jgi:hypothetical protein